MRPNLRRLLAATLIAIGLASAASGQEDANVYVVTYLEAVPTASAQVEELLKTYVSSARRTGGNLEFTALQRIGRRNHFAVLETWADAAALERYSRSADAERFRTSSMPLLYSPPDRRVHTGLVVEPQRDAGPDAVYVLTHIDVFPPAVAQVVEYLRTMAQASRAEAANARFDALVTDRKNHMTVVEVWQSADAQEAHVGRTHNIDFRTNLSAVQGALYDERLYRAIASDGGR